MRLSAETCRPLLLVICHALLSASNAADPECPCIDPWTGGLMANFIHWRGSQQCLSYRTSPGQQPFCYPIDYGARGCALYDAGLPPDCVEDGTAVMAQTLPRFCADPWCYVDQNNCNLEAHPSVHFPELNASYSYATCGTTDSFQETLLVKTLKGRSLRVGVPGMDPPFLFRDAAGELSGISPAFLVHMAVDAGFTLSFGSVFDDSRELFPQSSYTACARDVALKRVDMCAGIFWETPQRRALTQFSPLFFPDLFSLVVFKQDVDESTIALIYRVFQPFAPRLWGIFLGLTGVVGLVLWLFGEFDERNVVKAILMAQSLAILKFMGQTGWGRLRTVGSGFVATGFGFVCMVSMAFYMANTAAMLVLSDVQPAFENIEDALMHGARICVLEPLTGPLVGKYPLAEELIVPTGWFDESIYKMDRGECDAMLLNENEYSRMHGGVDYYGTGPGGKTGHCNKIQVGPPVLTVPAAMPIHKDIAFAISYLVTKASASGVWETSALKYQLQTNVCKAANEQKLRRLRPEDLSGALVIAGFLLVSGVSGHYIELYVHKATHKQTKEEGNKSSSTGEASESSISRKQMSLPGLETRIATMASHAAQLQKDFLQMQHTETKLEGVEAAIVGSEKPRRQDIPQLGCKQDELSNAAIEEAVMSHVTKLMEEIRQDVKADIQVEQGRFRLECDAHVDRLICKLDRLMQSPPSREADQDAIDTLHLHARLLAVETEIKSMKESSREERQGVKGDHTTDLPETIGRQDVKDMLHLHAIRLLSVECEIKAIKELSSAENQGAKGDPATRPPASMRQSLPVVEDSGVLHVPNIERRFSELEQRLLVNTCLVEAMANSSDLILLPKQGNTSQSSQMEHRPSEIDPRTGLSQYQVKETTDDEKRWAAIELDVYEFSNRLSKLEEQYAHLRDQYWVLEHTRAHKKLKKPQLVSV